MGVPFCRVEMPVALPAGGAMNLTLPPERLWVTTKQSFWWTVEATAAAGVLQNVAMEALAPQLVPGWQTVMLPEGQRAQEKAHPYHLTGCACGMACWNRPPQHPVLTSGSAGA